MYGLAWERSSTERTKMFQLCACGTGLTGVCVPATAGVQACRISASTEVDLPDLRTMRLRLGDMGYAMFKRRKQQWRHLDPPPPIEPDRRRTRAAPLMT